MYTPKGELNDKLVKLMQTEEFVKKLGEANDPDKCYEIAKEAGVELSKEEFVANMSVIKAYLEEQDNGLLSDEDLDQVAGGKSKAAEQGIDMANNILETINHVLEFATAAL